jgi:hypothetical protein
VQVTTVGGRKARYRRGGFPTREAAAAARQAFLDGPSDQAAAGAWTVAWWLRYWLTLAEPHLRPSTLHGYLDHIDRYLIRSIAASPSPTSPASDYRPASASSPASALGSGH